MKYLLIFCLLWCGVASQVVAEEQQEAVQQEENNSAFKGFLYKVWNRFKNLSPRETRDLDKHVAVTAGIRGAETKTSILKPYWKDDRTNDEAFLAQLQAFAGAQSLADKGDLQQANQAFQNFLEKWPDSDLAPNAQFGLAMTYGALGQKDQSIESFKTFIDQYEKHPLVADARAVIEELK